MNLRSRDRTFRQIFQGSDLSIPSFQMTYTWGKRELVGSDHDGFVPDVINAARENIGPKNVKIFVGPAVFLNFVGRKDFSRRRQIVDGQQRLTTLALVLCAIRQWIASDEALSNTAFRVNGRSEDLFSWCGRQVPVLFPVNGASPRMFRVNPRISSGFNALVRDSRTPPRITDWRQLQSTSSDPPAMENLRKSYGLIFGEVSRLLDEYCGATENRYAKARLVRKLFDSVLDSVHFLAIDVNKEGDALDLFINLNYGGKQLSPSDIVKAQVFQELTRTGRNWSSRLPSTRDFDLQWDVASSHIAKCQGTNFTRFMRHWLMTALPKAQKITQDTIVPKFKELVRENSADGLLSKDGVVTSLEKLVNASKMYRRMAEFDFRSHVLNTSLRRMTFLGDAHKIYLLRLFLLAGDSRVSKLRCEPELLRTVKLIENFYFRASFSGNLPQAIEDAFVKATAELGTRYSKAGMVRSQRVLRDCLKHSLPRASNDARMRELFSSPPTGHNRVFYVLTRIENASAKAEADIVHPPSRLDIEHILPVSSRKWREELAKIPAGKDRFDYVRNWGNLILIEQEINRSVGSESWAVKSRNEGRNNTEPCYRDSFVRSVRSVASKNRWGPTEILKRHEAIVGKMLRLTRV